MIIITGLLVYCLLWIAWFLKGPYLLPLRQVQAGEGGNEQNTAMVIDVIKQSKIEIDRREFLRPSREYFQ